MSELARLSPQELREFSQRVHLLCDLLYPSEDGAGAVAEPSISTHPQAGAPPATSPVPDGQRIPMPMRSMRPPSPGSFRSDVHEILRAASAPVHRSAIMEAVAQKRGLPLSDGIRASVAAVLKGDRDPGIRRVATGVYQFGLEH